MAEPEWFPTRRRFDDALDMIQKALEQHRADLALIARLEAELDMYRKAETPKPSMFRRHRAD